MNTNNNPEPSETMTIIDTIVSGISAPDFDGTISGATFVACEHGSDWIYSVMAIPCRVKLDDGELCGVILTDAELVEALGEGHWDEVAA